MEKLCFGIKVKKTSMMDEMDVAARLFLCPSIAPEHAVHVLNLLSKGEISLEKFVEKTEKEIQELLQKKENGEDIVPMMRDKWVKWTKFFFHEPTADDYDFLERCFGLTQCDLFGMMVAESQKKFSNAKSLADYVKKYIKGQDEAIEQLAVPFYQHLDSKRKQYTCKIKSSAIIMGPTGVGKSEMLRLFGEACDCPVIRINSADVTPTSWRGSSITDMLVKAINDTVTVKDLEYAVVVFHEFDKIVHYGQKIVGNNGTDMDADMMRDIMRLFETNHHLHLEGKFDSNIMSQTSYELPVDNLLIIFDGAFSGIENIIKKRLNIATTVGYSKEKQQVYEGVNLQKMVTKEDLQKWGYSVELLGRIGNVVVMNPLSEDVIYEIMTSAEGNVVQSHIDYCLHNNIHLHFEEDALRFIATEAYKSGLGFRNVKTLLSTALNSFYFDLPETTEMEQLDVEITKDYIARNIHVKQF